VKPWNIFRRKPVGQVSDLPEPRLLPGNAQDTGSREDQQDSFAFSDPDDTEFVRHGGFVAVLADGMGGLAHGQKASAEAVRAFLAGYSAKTPEESIREALERSARLANTAVAALAEKAGAEGNMGTTLVAAAVRPGALEWVSVGDSALYLYRRGELRRLSAVHNYGGELDEEVKRGVISVEEAQSHPDREALTSYIGAQDIAAIDLSRSPLALEPADCVLLCSDGLFRTLTPEEIAAELQADPQAACEALVQKTLARGDPHQDNVTVLCVKLESGEAARTLAGAHTSHVRA
jgi:protein phosphatase